MSQNPSKVDRLLAEQRDYIAKREAGYRERALKMYPWVCGRCAREFTRVNLRELTVHHVDHDHDNNPADGSNWELLCIYCHDHEHEKNGMAGHGGDGGLDKPTASTLFNPFGALDDLLPSDD